MITAHIESSLTGRPSTVRLPTEPNNRELVSEVTLIAQDAGQRRLWGQHRIVYDMDPDLWAELGDVEDTQVIPFGVMRALPHPDPFVALPDRPILPVDDQFVMRVEGFFVTGRANSPDGDGYTQVSTHAPSANGNLGLLFGATVLHRDTSEPFRARLPGASHVSDTVWSRVTLDVGYGDSTVGELITAIGPRFRLARNSGAYEDTVPVMIRKAIGALVYVCATNAQLGPVRNVKAERVARSLPGGSPKAKPVRGVEVGFHVGAALRAHRAREEAQGAAERAAGGAGRTVRPHIRRAHFHTFRHGPGKSLAKVKWLPPIPINADVATDDRPTAHRIKKG